MPKRRRKSGDGGGLSYDEIVGWSERVNEDFSHADPPGSRNLDAFLTLSVLMEGVLRRLALLHLESDEQYVALRGKRHNRYGLDSAIDDLCLLHAISVEDYKALEKFKSDRNRCMHEILGMRSDATVQEYAGKLFLQHRPVFETMLDKLHQRL